MKKQSYLSYYIHSFLIEYLPNERGFSDNTILTYRDALKLFMTYCSDQMQMNVTSMTCEQVSDKLICGFLDHCENKRNWSPKTRNARLAALKTFASYLGRQMPECLENSRKINTIAQKKAEHKIVDYLDSNEVNAIIDQVNTSNRHGARDKALLLLMYNTGARVQEIVDIRLTDMRLDAASQVILTCKGKKKRIVPLWKETINVIKYYLSERKPGKDNENHLFLNNKGESITRFGIRYIIKKYTEKAKLFIASLKQKKVNPHTFRHTTAMHLLQSGNELNMVRLWLGHVSLNTTHMYIEIDMAMKRKILSKALPPKIKHHPKKWQKPDIIKWLEDITLRSQLCEG